MIDDKFQQHYRQQMSALMDGELAPDQARFLMRRMAEDHTLNDTWERWQLCGDVLRGRAQAPAPQGFAERVSAAIAVQALQPAANQEFRRSGRGLLRWGGGAIAAAVALLAVFMAGQQNKPASSAPRPTALASGPAPAAARPAAPAAAAAPTPRSDAGAALAASAVAVAGLPQRADDSRRSRALRNQRAARATEAITRQSLAAVQTPPAGAAAAAPAVNQDPFVGVHLGQVAARPWPRTSLPQLHAGGAYSAGYALGERAPYDPFQPFQPRLPEAPADSAAPPTPSPQP